MNKFKKLYTIWLVVLILLTNMIPAYGYNSKEILELAESLLGIPFEQGGSTPDEGFNSTGFVQYVFREGKNIFLPNSPSQLWKLGKPIERNNIQPGDVLFFNGSKNIIPAIYKGDDTIIVVSTDKSVGIRNIAENPYWRDRYKGARRYTNMADELNPLAVKALELVGSPYELGGNDPSGFDHSGFVQYVFSEIYDLDFPRTSKEQQRIGLSVDIDDLESGDVLFFQGSNVLLPGIYIDNGIFVIVTTNGVASVDLKTSDYWKPRLLEARRFTRDIVEQAVTVDNPIVIKALDLLGTPYNYEGKSPSEGFNTTSFVRYVFKNVLNIEFSAFSDRIYEIGESISKEKLQAGDLVFFRGSSLIPGIYKGNGIFIVQTTEGVAERDIESEYWADIYVGAKRLTEDDIYYSQPENYREHENSAIREAMKYIGTPYLLGGETVDGFDCSYLVQTVFKDAKNIYLPRITYKQCEIGETVDYENKRPGDVIYFSKEDQPEEISHASIYLGDNYIIHASGSEGMTTISYLGQYLLDRLVMVKRFDSLSLPLDFKIVEEAYNALGVPYLAGGNTIEGFDYSGFIQYVMKAGLDIDLPRYSFQQWALGTEIEKEDLNIGDILFFEGSNNVLLPGLYVGNGQFSIVTKFEGVTICNLNISDSYWTPRYVGARRYEKEALK